MDNDIIDILHDLQRRGEERMKKSINRTIIDAAGDPIIYTYERVMREQIAARAVHRSVEYVRKIYHNIDKEDLNKLFNDLFYTTMNLLDKLEGTN